MVSGKVSLFESMALKELIYNQSLWIGEKTKDSI